jgi:hypothetical protein
MPCVTKAVSKATTGLPCASASLTSSDIIRGELMCFIDDVRRPEGFADVTLTGRRRVELKRGSDVEERFGEFKGGKACKALCIALRRDVMARSKWCIARVQVDSFNWR